MPPESRPIYPLVTAIFIADAGKQPMRAVTESRALPGIGLEGDRYGLKTGTWSKWRDQSGLQLTLVAQESLELASEETGIDLNKGAHRRNIITMGIDLQTLIGKRFRIGEAICTGTRPCIPCGYLERMTGDGVKSALMRHGKGGLRAEIKKGGIVRVGDKVEILEK